MTVDSSKLRTTINNKGQLITGILLVDDLHPPLEPHPKLITSCVFLFSVAADTHVIRLRYSAEIRLINVISDRYIGKCWLHHIIELQGRLQLKVSQ